MPDATTTSSTRFPTADYYSLAGIFKSTKSMQNHKVVAMWNERVAGDRRRARRSSRRHKKEVARREAEIKKLSGKAGNAIERGTPPPARCRWPICKSSVPPIRRSDERRGPGDHQLADPHSRQSSDSGRGSAATIPESPGRAKTSHRSNQARSGRLELAKWLTGHDHPLTARVMVNRLWLWHFGEGLVGSPDNFGRLGDRPVNLELLDWLARRFIASGWSIKAMHRLIMLSSTYQMSTRFDPAAAQIDPENRLHWRTSRRRLEAEAIRDAILAVSGRARRDHGRNAPDREESRLCELDDQERRPRSIRPIAARSICR